MKFPSHCFCLALLFVAFLNATKPLPQTIAAEPHPFHSTIAEVEWNAKSKSLEIALSVWPVDLEAVLAKSEKIREDVEGPISLDDETQKEVLDQGIRAYVNQRFRRTDVDDNQKINWLGFEIEKDSVWCYFEIKDVEAGELEFENRLFFELHPDQQNTILLKQGRKRAAVHFVGEHPVQTLPIGAVGRNSR